MENLVSKQIVGIQLSAVTFVMNYYQFRFDGPYFNVLTSVKVESASSLTLAISGDDQFRNLVCAQIGKIVRSVCVRDEDAITITFEDSSQIHFSLKEKEFLGSEAVIYYGNDGEWGYF